MREQLQAGLNMGIAGIPWWTSDIGGFLGGDISDPAFQELRQYLTFFHLFISSPHDTVSPSPCR
ncbi:MAG: hypothetical protein OSJ72_07995 [Lachnospiraceae bacterium]|nr:hypothetical protein [Lachnospiraceae bacterium]